MKDHKSICTQKAKQILKSYLKIFPNEKGRLQKLEELFSSKEDISSRSNMKGHLTASALVYFDNKFLFIHHKTLDKWLFPGGHMKKNDEDFYHSAFREAEEETGVKKSHLILSEWHINNQYIPIDIDIHPIAENKSKNEGDHYHHDLKFLVNLNQTKEISLDTNEVIDFAWLAIKDFPKGEMFDRLIGKLKNISEG
jgi:8-oxo-dGTP pyrophosphatase MutT (NUDIX family)